MKPVKLRIRKLTRAAFAPFGDVIDVAGSRHWTTNQGFAERFHDLASLDLTFRGGRPIVSVFRAKPRTMPLRIEIMERHPLSSQAFVPMTPGPFLVVVARPGKAPTAKDMICFRTTGSQGINYARGTWHHPLIALERRTDFLTIDRGGKGANCDEVYYADSDIFVAL